MADKNIGSLPSAPSFDDSSLLVAEQQGEAVKVEGAQLRVFAERAAAAVQKGDPGEDFQILGYYDTLDLLEAAQRNPKPGDAYGVGTVAPYTIYIWDGVSLEWKDNGTIQGPSGATFIPSVDSNGNLSWTNNGGLENPDPVRVKGDPFTYEDFTEEQLESLTGPQGVSIVSINKTGGTGAAGTTDTYTITLSSGATSTFTIYNGKNGENGNNIERITRTSGNGAPGTTDTYTVTLTDGSTTTFQVYNGKDGEGAGDMTAAVYDPQGKAQDIFKYAEDLLKTIDASSIVFSDGQTWQQKYDAGAFAGQDGVGIASIQKTSGTGAAGTTDTYTITLTNGSTATFTVYNGKNGKNGDPGYTPQKNVDYFDGAPGYTPVKGTDYWTAADKAEMVADVLAALPAAEGVSF